MTRYYKRHADGYIDLDLPSFEDAVAYGIENNTYEGELVRDYNGCLWLPTDTIPEKPLDVCWAEIRVKRDYLLSQCDWTQVSDAPVDKDAWAIYRQALRDITNQPDPNNIVWPITPGEES